MLILAHRGASADAPENTLQAFEEALRQGADGVELDVQRCASGEVVACHDERLGRVAGVDLELRRTAYWKLRRLDVGGPLGHRAARIPLLEEALEVLGPGRLVNVELKCDTLDDGGLTQATLEVLRRANALDRVVVSSFNPLCLVRLAALEPRVRRGYLLDPERSPTLHGRVLAPVVCNHSVHPHVSLCTPRRVAAWRGMGRALAVWTVNDAAQAARLSALGVRYLITDRPGRLRAALEARPGRPEDA